MVCRIRGSVPAAIKPDAWGKGSWGLERPPCDPARGPRAGMHRAGSRWRVGGWVARERAAERGSSRELPPEKQQGPAVSLETLWPMRATEAVYEGGASPWQQEKPSERLLNAGPRAVGAQRSAVGRRGGATRGASRTLDLGTENRGRWEELLPEPSSGPAAL